MPHIIPHSPAAERLVCPYWKSPRRMCMAKKVGAPSHLVSPPRVARLWQVSKVRLLLLALLLPPPAASSAVALALRVRGSMWLVIRKPLQRPPPRGAAPGPSPSSVASVASRGLLGLLSKYESDKIKCTTSPNTGKSTPHAHRQHL